MIDSKLSLNKVEEIELIVRYWLNKGCSCDLMYGFICSIHDEQQKVLDFFKELKDAQT